VSIFLVLVLMC